ncbi:lysophospholipid acyltransferase family protein [Pelodictyon luteolum]|uniref:Phospholipid/glycerol acyltransferase n=1 Tax=Chlorobium luteolum (strain DSM 273 / BCRC 81028 / 2530) TaxID=319225 RepID=Q3B3G9_CHLL3|nr:lysophospholipid acyltransferase family protein [Pelodictyon luteolum]ABB24112.1 Phospholipid/glycerol acyltransferase [Pelodictyon luteolum DSM 273]
MKDYFRPLPRLSPMRALLLRLLMLPNFFLLKAEGLGNLPGDGRPYIFAFNHNNSAEALMVPIFFIYHMGGRTISFVIDWMYGRVPVLGKLMGMIDPVYVYNKRSTLSWIESSRPVRMAEDTVERCCRKIASGRSIGIFPEGRRNRNADALAKGKSGIGHIALTTGAPVIPVGIDFPLRIQKGRIPILGRTIIRVGTPIDFTLQSEAYRAVKKEEQGGVQRRAALANEVTHRVMHCLADLSGKRYQGPMPNEHHALYQQPYGSVSRPPFAVGEGAL